MPEVRLPTGLLPSVNHVEEERTHTLPLSCHILFQTLDFKKNGIDACSRKLSTKYCVITEETRIKNVTFHYPASLRRVTPKTGTNITRYLYSFFSRREGNAAKKNGTPDSRLYSRGPVRRVFSQHASDRLNRSYGKSSFPLRILLSRIPHK